MGAKCSPNVFQGGKLVAHVIVEYVNVSPSTTGIDSGSVATVVGWPLGVPNCVPASVRPSMMIEPFAFAAAAVAGATAASDAMSARTASSPLDFILILSVRAQTGASRRPVPRRTGKKYPSTRRRCEYCVVGFLRRDKDEASRPAQPAAGGHDRPQLPDDDVEGVVQQLAPVVVAGMSEVPIARETLELLQLGLPYLTQREYPDQAVIAGQTAARLGYLSRAAEFALFEGEIDP